MTMTIEASGLVFYGMLLLPLVVAGVVATGLVWSAEPAHRMRRLIFTDLIATAWLAVPAAFALRGTLTQFDTKPPPMMLLLAVRLLATVGIALGPVGRDVVKRVPLVALVGLQGFRLPLELVMHQAAVEQLMPPQMTFTGHNFDIVTGATAIVMAVLIANGRASRGLVLAWNVMGTLLLLTIMGIAIASTPTFAAYGPHMAQLNTWVAYFPYVWLPFVLVCTALLGHLLVFRQLQQRA